MSPIEPKEDTSGQVTIVTAAVHDGFSAAVASDDAIAEACRSLRLAIMSKKEAARDLHVCQQHLIAAGKAYDEKTINAEACLARVNQITNMTKETTDG